MKERLKKNSPFLFATLLLLIIFQNTYCQVIYEQSISTIKVEGTSTLHDWHMLSNEANFIASLEVTNEGVPIKLISATMTVEAESLKSGKRVMDKNAYASLKTDEFKQITFQLTSSKLTAKSMTCTGNLTVAGATKPVDIEVFYEVHNRNIYYKGEKKLKMSEFNVEPPTFMFGSFKTGDDVTISFDAILTPLKTSSKN